MEVGRALSAHRIISKANDSLLAGNYKKVLKILGKEKINKETAKMMSTLDFNNPSEVSRFIRESMPVKTIDKINTREVDHFCVIRNWVYRILKDDFKKLLEEYEE